MTSRIDSPLSVRRLGGKCLQDPPFVGNAIGYAQVEASVSEQFFSHSLDNVEKLTPIIKLVSKSTASLAASSIASQVHLSDKSPKFFNITRTWLLNGPVDLHSIGGARLAAYELDFGPRLGKPGFMRKASIRLGGVMNFLPRRPDEDGYGAVDLSFMLLEESTRKGWLFETSCVANDPSHWS